MKKLIGIFLGLVLVAGLARSTFGQVLENYNSAFEITHRFEPFYSPERATVEVNVKDFPSAQFKISVPKGASVFVENVLWQHADADTSFIVGSDTWRTQFPSQSATRKVSILKRDLQPRMLSLHKGYFEDATPIVSEPILVETAMVKRGKDRLKEFFYIALVIVMGLVALYKVVFPVVFTNMLKPASVFTAEDFADSHAKSRIFSTDVIFYLVIFNMLLMLIVVLAVYFMEVSILRNFLRGELNFLFLVWLLGSVVLFVISVGKVMWLKATTSIYEVGRLEFIHFFYMLRVFSYTLLVLVAFITLGLANDIMETRQLISYSMVLFFILYIGGVSMLFFFMTKKVSFKNYHLFSYLCTAELIPFLAIVKLIIG
ncbi:DUF4271 domain-containing protein [Litoribacter ruber]|uniref:DUF4271 domain-containing protein n=1 Tax=Litoribacter ruber TaxID=702568 RepID=UPI001BDABC7B|nr:DUF4271 domain-containing protein [Litoribacter ruber]MBT0809977.1 DUF4271 domain-containing protein [Litoribacter ruber]